MNPQKMIAENKLCTMRSSWESKFVMKFLDARSDCVSWSSEDFCIPYLCPIRKNLHRYFPDFLASFKTKDGSIVEKLIEIKPYDQTTPESLKKPKRITKGYIEKVNTYIINCAKWEAAKKWCEVEKQKGRSIEFVIITEKDLPFIT